LSPITQASQQEKNDTYRIVAIASSLPKKPLKMRHIYSSALNYFANNPICYYNMTDESWKALQKNPDLNISISPISTNPIRLMDIYYVILKLKNDSSFSLNFPFVHKEISTWIIKDGLPILSIFGNLGLLLSTYFFDFSSYIPDIESFRVNLLYPLAIQHLYFYGLNPAFKYKFFNQLLLAQVFGSTNRLENNYHLEIQRRLLFLKFL
jgi:hypothetical protein